MKIEVVCAVICLSAVCFAESEDKNIKKVFEKDPRTLLQSSGDQIKLEPEAGENTEVESSGTVRDKRWGLFGGFRRRPWGRGFGLGYGGYGYGPPYGGYGYGPPYGYAYGYGRPYYGYNDYGYGGATIIEHVYV